MPRGRHRNSSPLRRLLPPLAVGVLAALSASAAALSDDPLLLRVAAGCAAFFAVIGAVLMRVRDRAAAFELEGELAARSRSESASAQRIAALESACELAEDARARHERQLARQREELGRRNERIMRIESENALQREEMTRLGRDRSAAVRARAEESAARRAAEEGMRRAWASSRVLEQELGEARARAERAAPEPVRPTAELFERALAVLRTLEQRTAETASAPVAEVGAAARIVASIPLRARAVPVAGGAAPAVHEVARPERAGEPVAEEHGGGRGEEAPEVIDLAAEDETETIDVVALRSRHA